MLRRRVRGIAAEQRTVLESVHPDPAAWPAVLAAGRLWERRAADPDFGQLRIGRGAQRLATRLVAPQTGPVEGLEPVTALALRRFLLGHAVVPDLPVALSLRASSTVWLEPADPGVGLGPARALARAIVAQYTLWHSPSDALLAVVAPPTLAPEWEWVKWLPHVGHPRRRDAVGPLRMISADADDVRRWWVAELAGRPAGPGMGEPHLLVVVDEVAEGPGPWAGVAGVTVLRVGAPPGRRPGPSVVRLLVGRDGLHRIGGDQAPAAGDERPALIGQPDGLGVAEARALARRLARYRPGGAEPVGDATPRTAPGLPAMLGLEPGQAGIAALRARWARSETHRLRVPIGVDERGGPVMLDLKESAQGGSGPHGLCVGATGSGKSEGTLWHTKFPRRFAAPLRVAIYVRISPIRAAPDWASNAKRTECRELAEQLGWTTAVERRTPTTTCRPTRASHAPRTGACSRHPRRPGRRVLRLAHRPATPITGRARRMDHGMRAAGRGGPHRESRPLDLATPSGRMVARQLGAVARYESEHRSERVAASMEQIARQGGYLGGPRPFGYTDGGMQLDPIEAPLIAEGTKLILSGRSLRSVVKLWNDAGTTTTKKRQPWMPDSVRDALMRPRNAGLLEHRGRVVGPARWPAIVSEDEWRGVCAALNNPARRTSPGNQPRWLGSMLYRCGVCDGPLVVGTSGQTAHPSYRCRSHNGGGPAMSPAPRPRSMAS